MDLEKAVKQIGDLQAEVATLRSHKERLESDLKDARDKRKAAEEHAQKLVPEGAIVLTPEDAKVFEAYKQLGKPGDLKTALESKGTAEQELAALKRREVIREAAGDKLNAKALMKFLPDTAEITASDGKDGKVYTITTRDGDKEVKTPLVDWVKNVETDLGISLHVEQGKPAPVGHGKTPPAGPADPDTIRQAKARTGMYDTL